MRQRVEELYRRHERYAPAGFFTAGFLFDILTLGRIDSWFSIAQQAAYLALAGYLVTSEIRERTGRWLPPKALQRFWKFRDRATHFMLGSLLSAFTLFYFKSASLSTSFLFLLLMISLLVANEFERMRGLGAALRVTLFALCAVSWFVYVVPVVLGFIGVIPFMISIGASGGVFLCVSRWLRRRVAEGALAAQGPELDRLVRREFRIPVLATHAVITAAYFFQIIPPIPLSISYMGIYRSVTKEQGKYRLEYSRPAWKFWQNGDQSFAWRPGDPIVGFARIFSPSGFKDQVQVRWLLKDRRGWQTQDVIPVPIVGGREQGFRGYTIKKNVQPGDWRFQVETSDGREIGRIGFRVYADESVEPRLSRYDVQ
jgi:hypothetical protein